ncbi:adhesion G protein-coupled receptor D2 [Hemitrygon akajei]|uniref:adhesion G protein-coupled receptor D2 n=1 Tax=Hemitrygon akajei TaxID=2704970 RepID=UPI003BF9A8FD
MYGSTIAFCALLACSVNGILSQASGNSLYFDSSYHSYEYITTPLTWQQASKYCELRFGRLPDISDAEGKSVILEWLVSRSVKQPIWLNRELNEVLEKKKSTKANSVSVLMFPNKTDTKYAKLLGVLPSMSAITVCVNIQCDDQANTVATVFSYAVPTFMNEFQLRARINDTGFIQLALIVHGHHTPYQTVLKNDGQWHHICVTWRSEEGAWSFYADGCIVSSGQRYYSSQVLAGNGVFIIGQDQDSLGGTFKQSEAFSGNITGLNIWSGVLDRSQIAAASGCSLPHQRLIYQWSLSNLEIEHTVEIKKALVSCSGTSASPAECQSFDAVSGAGRKHDCEIPLPFLCQFNKDIYRKLKKFESEPTSIFKTKLNNFFNVTVTDYMSLSGVKLVRNVSEAAVVMKAVQHVLSTENTTLPAVDLLNVVSLLQNVAGMEVGTSDARDVLEDISQSFLDVAGEVLDQSNAESWSKIGEIVRGPMTVVYGVDRMVENLNKVLAVGQKDIVIRNKNIQLEIRQKLLHNFTNDFEVSMGDGINKSSDQIGLSKQAIARLQGEGLTTATFVNTWYRSLPNLRGNNPLVASGLVETAFNEGFKHIGTEVASAVISSTVYQGRQEVSAPTHYRLLHRIKADPLLSVDSLCAFWDFSLKPESGGSWSTNGCSVVQSDQQSTACFCNHTTNFALLFQLYEIKRSPDEEAVLMKLTLTGCSVSLCAMVITLIVFSVLGVPKSDRTTVHKNLISALIAAQALLLTSESARTHRVACWVVTVLLHLFFMAAFSWMLVEGILLWSKVVTVNMSEDKRVKYYYLIGWGFPVFIVVITIATTGDGYMADSHCWLNIESSVIWAFVGPVLFTLTVNTFVLCRVVMITVVSSRRRSMMLVPGARLPHRLYIQMWVAIKPVAILLPVLGLTWFCGVLVHLNITLGYVFVVLNSFQGLYIFLVYTLYNSEVRSAVKRMREKKKALSFKSCTNSRPSSCLSGLRTTPTLSAGECSVPPPARDASNSPISTKRSTVSEDKAKAFRGELGAEGLTRLSTNTTADKKEIELIAFRVSGL